MTELQLCTAVGHFPTETTILSTQRRWKVLGGTPLCANGGYDGPSTAGFPAAFRQEQKILERRR
jgi:hypothetical protein